MFVVICYSNCRQLTQALHGPLCAAFNAKGLGELESPSWKPDHGFFSGSSALELLEITKKLQAESNSPPLSMDNALSCLHSQLC